MYKRTAGIAALLLLSFVCLTLCPLAGQIELDYAELFQAPSESLTARVFWQIRVPRALLAFVAGGGLAVSGLVYQAMFQNVLASPYTLGVAGGAAFGAALVARFEIPASLLGLPAGFIGALSGAALTAALVPGLSALGRRFSSESMLLSGVIISFFFSSLIMLLQYLSDSGQVFAVTRWLMGSLSGEAAGLGITSAMVICGLLVILLLGPQVDLLSLGDELAVSRGLNARRARLILFGAVSLIVAGVVSTCGPIGFVGLIVPYVCRALLGHSGHRLLSIAAVLLGGSFLLLCDTLARVAIAPFEIPAGVITALLGGPFFLWILLRRH